MAKKKKKGKYDITVKTNLSPDELLKLAANTPLPNSKVNKSKNAKKQ